MEEKISSMWAFFISAIIQNRKPNYKARYKKTDTGSRRTKDFREKSDKSTMKNTVMLATFLS
jgi:hypothetical protein